MPAPERRPSGPPRQGNPGGDRLPVDPDLAPDDPGEPASDHHRGARVHRSRQPGVLAAIAAGGFLGTLARYGIGLWLPTGAGWFPWATFIVNTSGALLLGVVLTLLLGHQHGGRHLRPFVCVGCIGAWTTMSTFALDSDLLLDRGRAARAVLYMGVTVLCGVSATAVGIWVGRARKERDAWRSR